MNAHLAATKSAPTVLFRACIHLSLAGKLLEQLLLLGHGVHEIFIVYY